MKEAEPIKEAAPMKEEPAKADLKPAEMPMLEPVPAMMVEEKKPIAAEAAEVKPIKAAEEPIKVVHEKDVVAPKA